MKKLIITPSGEEIVDLTTEEIAQREKDTNQDNLYEQEKQDAEIKKASGKQKLKDLGLTDEEIQALIGV
jgi:flagellar motility protein MotE (MotC chaperone)